MKKQNNHCELNFHDQKIRWRLTRDIRKHVDAYFQTSWEDVTLEVTVSFVKSTDVTYKTYSG